MNASGEPLRETYGKRIHFFVFVERSVPQTALTNAALTSLVEHRRAMNDAKLEGLITVFIKGCDSFADLSQLRLLEEHKEAATGALQVDSLPIMNDRDTEILKCLAKIKNQGSDCIDFLSLSYVSNREQIVQARQTLDSLGLSNAKIMAKVESQKGLARFQSILDEADGIIISRGNLGIDVDVERFPMLQKALIQACNAAGKPVLTTRVVDSMCLSPRPTRAEATDISNMVLDGVDGVVLGAETLRGLFPVLSVKTVLCCAKEAEQIFDNSGHFGNVMKRTGFLSQLESMASSTVRVADKIHAALIVVVTGSGRTARLVAKYRPDVPVIALTGESILSLSLCLSALSSLCLSALCSLLSAISFLPAESFPPLCCCVHLCVCVFAPLSSENQGRRFEQVALQRKAPGEAEHDREGALPHACHGYHGRGRHSGGLRGARRQPRHRARLPADCDPLQPPGERGPGHQARLHR